MVSSANGGNFFGQVNFKTDSAVVAFGVDNDVTLTHVADTGLKLKIHIPLVTLVSVQY